MAGSGKTRRQRTARITEHKPGTGWAAAPGIRVRHVVPADMDAVCELATLAGVTLDDVLPDAVASGTAGQALRAGLSKGQEVFNWHIAEQFTVTATTRCRPTCPPRSCW